MSAALTIQLLLLGVMLVGSFCFSSSETALFSLAARHKSGLKDDDRRSDRVRELLARPHHLLVLLLLGNNVVNIAAAELAQHLVAEGAGQWGWSPVGTVAASVLTATGLLLIVGEIGPKTIALQVPVALAKVMARPLLLLDSVLAPVISAFAGATGWVLHGLGVDGPLAAQVTEEELKTLVSVSEQEGLLERDEREMIGRVFDLGDTLVREVFVPRPDVVRVGLDATVRDVLAVSSEYGHARIPVIGDTIDDIRGICHVKDLIPYVRQGKLDHPVADLLRRIVIVPDTKRLDDCLREFRRQRTHLAVVVDEYGGTAGIVTLEDLVEQIVGDIFDEYDDYESPIVRLDARRWRVEGNVSLGDLEDAWGQTLTPQTEYDTLGGLVLELFGRFPYAGEAVERDGITYTVEKVAENRLQRILVDFPLKGAAIPHADAGTPGPHGAQEERA